MFQVIGRGMCSLNSETSQCVVGYRDFCDTTFLGTSVNTVKPEVCSINRKVDSPCTWMLIKMSPMFRIKV